MCEQVVCRPAKERTHFGMGKTGTGASVLAGGRGSFQAVVSVMDTWACEPAVETRGKAWAMPGRCWQPPAGVSAGPRACRPGHEERGSKWP